MDPVLAVRWPVVVRILEQIGDVHHAPAQRDPADQGAVRDRRGVGALVLGQRRGAAVRGDQLEHVALASEQIAPVAATELCRVLDDDVEDRLKIERGSTDRLQDVGGRGLLLESFFRLVEEAHVLDRDGGLARERLEDLDLTRAEQRDVEPAHDDDPFDLRVAHDRDAEEGLRDVRGRAGGVVVRIGADVLDLDRLARKQHATEEAPLAGLEGAAGVITLVVVETDLEPTGAPQDLVTGGRIAAYHGRVVGPAEPHRVLRDRAEHLSQIEAGGAHRLEHLAGRDLLLARARQRRRGVGVVRAACLGRLQAFLPTSTVMLGVRVQGRKP